MHCGSSETLTAQDLHFNGSLLLKDEQGPTSWLSGSTGILCVPNTSKVTDASGSSGCACHLPHTSSSHWGGLLEQTSAEIPKACRMFSWGT